MKNYLEKKRVTHNNIMLTFAVIVILLLSVFIRGRAVDASRSREYAKNFITVEVESGDTLTSLAEEHCTPDTSIREYIDEVKSINNLGSDVIHAGCYLVIPDYIQVN